MFEDLGRTVLPKQGLKQLTIEYFADKNELQEWVLKQLALHSHALMSLKFNDFTYTTDTNKSRLLEFAGRAITSSRCFTTLHI